jgi:hypothetical protein
MFSADRCGVSLSGRKALGFRLMLRGSDSVTYDPVRSLPAKHKLYGALIQ